MSAFWAFVYDAFLDIAYVISFAIALYLARLVDEGAFRLLEAIT